MSTESQPTLFPLPKRPPAEDPPLDEDLADVAPHVVVEISKACRVRNITWPLHNPSLNGFCRRCGRPTGVKSVM